MLHIALNVSSNKRNFLRSIATQRIRHLKIALYITYFKMSCKTDKI